MDYFHLQSITNEAENVVSSRLTVIPATTKGESLLPLIDRQTFDKEDN
jgi:hypothetical protein